MVSLCVYVEMCAGKRPDAVAEKPLLVAIHGSWRLAHSMWPTPPPGSTITNALPSAPWTVACGNDAHHGQTPTFACWT